MLERILIPEANPFAIRGINVCESLSRHTPEQIRRLLARVVEWKMNTLIVPPQYGFRKYEADIRSFCRERGIHLVQYLYSCLAFAPDAPRDCFAVDKSGRPHRGRMECETRLCASHPGARQCFREGARRYLGEKVEAGDQLLLATPDGLLLCECEACRSLGPIAQWQPFLEIAVEEIARSGKKPVTHFIAYVGRFRPPEDMGIFERIDCVMFDTHLRHRWSPLGTSHGLGPAELIEGRYDPEALKTPINQYLLARLREWRERYRGKLYVFENLMIQACFSLPQPNTAALLQDLRTFRELGIDGVVYEAFEPGIGAFEKQLDVLFRALAGERVEYQPSELERICAPLTGADTVRTRTTEYLYTPECQSRERLISYLGAPHQAELAIQLREYLIAPTLSKWRDLTRLVLTRREEWDWIYIIYRLATYLPVEERPTLLTSAQARLFSTPKPWDFLEKEADPQAAMLDLAHSLLDPSQA